MVNSFRLQALLWLFLWAGLTFVTRKFHPTLFIGISATFCLEFGSAACVYANRLILIPRFLGSRRLTRYLASLFLVIAGSTIAVVALIQLVYAILWHPDPRRFGLMFNLISDGLWISMHVAIAAMAGRLLRRPGD